MASAGRSVARAFQASAPKPLSNQSWFSAGSTIRLGVLMKRVVVICGLSLAAASACSRRHAETRASSEAPTVAVAPVLRGDVSQVLKVAAEFRPYQHRPDEATLDQALAAIERNARVQNRLVDDVLDHGRPRSQPLATRPARCIRNAQRLGN